MEEPFPYEPLVKPDGWDNAYTQATTSSDGELPANDGDESATGRASALKGRMSSAFVLAMLVAATGWLYSMWITVVAVLAMVLAITVVIVRACLSDSDHRAQRFENSIVEQLEQRPEHYRWSNADARRLQIVECIAEIVANEKPISEPSRRALHPDDPLQLLFWGPYDDWSPLLFQFEFAKKFDIGGPAAFRRERIFEAIANDSSLRQFVECCEMHLDAFGIKTAVATKNSCWDNITERTSTVTAWLNLTQGEIAILAVIVIPILIVISILVFT